MQTVTQSADGKCHVVTKPIEKIRKGELVLARNERSGKTTIRRVLKTYVRHTDLVLTVSLADAKTHKVVQKLMATREHPFYVRGKGFTPAGGLAVGNAIVTRAGPALMVQSVSWHRRATGYTVYNLKVEDDHSYFAGTAGGGTWVHNADGYDAVGGLFGILEGKSATVSAKGLGIVENHLSQFGDVEINNAMVERLRAANASGQPITGADLGFYAHELSEATFMRGGMGYEEAHAAALSKYGVSPFSVYHPEVIGQFPEFFNSNWRNAWNMK